MKPQWGVEARNPPSNAVHPDAGMANAQGTPMDQRLDGSAKCSTAVSGLKLLQRGRRCSG